MVRPVREVSRMPASPAFRYLLASSTVSFFGTAITTVALPLVALTTLGASTFEVGLISAAGVVSWLVLGLFVGVWTDRLPRRRLMIVCDIVRAFALASVPVAAAVGMLSLAQVVVVALVLGVGTVFFDVTSQAFLPSVVSRDELVAGNGAMQASSTAAQTAGPAAGGLLVQLAGAPLTLVVDVVSYLTSAALLGRVPAPDRRPPPARGRMWPQVREGMAYVFADPIMRPLALVAASLNLLLVAAETLTVPFLLRTVSVPPATIGLLLAIGGGGAGRGAAPANRQGARFGSGWLLLAAVLAGPLFGLLVPGARSSIVGIALFALGMFGREFCVATVSLVARSYRQITVPDHLLGRVTASIKFLSWGVLPIGALLAGTLGSLLGNRAAMWTISLLLLLTPLPVLFSELRQGRDLLAVANAPQADGAAGSDSDRG
jgi:predicted MFS family arabinose efflux permease